MTAWTLLYLERPDREQALAIPLRIFVREFTPQQAQQWGTAHFATKHFVNYKVAVTVDLPLPSADDFLQAVEMGVGLSREVAHAWGLVHSHDILGIVISAEQGRATLPRSGVIDGKSAGLLSALLFLEGYLRQWWRREVPFAYAATGAVDAAGAVTSVGAINAKIGGALATLEAGSKVFYPRPNDAELAPEHRRAAEAQGIRLIPVSTVGEALHHFFDLEVRMTPPAGSPETRLACGQACALHGTVASPWWGALEAHAFVWTCGEHRLGTGPTLVWTPEHGGCYTITLRLAAPLDQPSHPDDCSAATLTLEVVQAEHLEVAIRIQGAGRRVAVGTTLELHGAATSNVHGALDGGALAWRSDREVTQDLGVGRTLEWTPQTPGRHTLVLTATSPSGVSRIATVVVEVHAHAAAPGGGPPDVPLDALASPVHLGYPGRDARRPAGHRAGRDSHPHPGAPVSPIRRGPPRR